ncbi:MAG TPA: oligosaccharide flippase family protein [Flavobacteriales bacterium]|nr:oligosaccharide flippase family protein [Flavobacteriales bacterium]
MPVGSTQPSFISSLATLFTGTVLAQAIPFLAAPWIARLYDAPQFTLFGAMLAVFNVLNVVVTGRYELAIVQPVDRKDAADLLRGGLVLSVLMGIVLCIGLETLHGPLESRFGLQRTGGVLIVLAMLAVFAGLQAFWQQWLLRARAFKSIAQVKVLQAVSITGLALGMGAMGASGGLVLSYLFGWFLFALGSWLVVNRVAPVPGAWDRTRSVAMLRRYREFPLHNAWPALLNALASGAAVMYMSMFYAPQIAGEHNFARQYLLVPIGMISAALGQVLFERTASAVRDGRPVLADLRRVVLSLSAIALVGALLMTAAGESMFAVLFGEAWRGAGKAATILVWGYGAQLVAGPLGMQLLAMGKVKAFMIFPLIFAAMLAVVPFFRDWDPMHFMALLSAVEVVAYGAYAALVWYHVARYDRNLSTVRA